MKRIKFSQIIQKCKQAVRRYDDTHNFTCNVCGREVFSNERVCAKCIAGLPFNNKVVCPLCGRKVGEPGICLECKSKPLAMKKARSCFLHEGEAARLVVRYKRGEKYLYRTLCDFLQPVLSAEFAHADSITFVPMTERALRDRGYNQSFLLAEELSSRTGKELLSPAVKTKETRSQKFLGRKDREENLKGCFHISERKAVRGRTILIIDDTMTTGATANELADALLRAGAAEVDLLTVTSVRQKDPFGIPPEKKSASARKRQKG